MEGIEIRVIDREAMIHLVQGLENFEKDKALQSGLRAGATVFQRGGMRRLKQRMKNPKGVKGNLLRSFTVRVKRSKLGALSGFKYGDNGGGHSWLLDMGTDKRSHKKTGKSTGVGPALRYWTDTREQDYPTAINKMYDGIERAVNRITGRRQ
ncbi:hypothetical protein [Bacteroides sp.]|uniref:hypothetical protein n=1 Tax=Bacteroides sp. TaxID=29523 RepID=UPI002FC9EDF0